MGNNVEIIEPVGHIDDNVLRFQSRVIVKMEPKAVVGCDQRNKIEIVKPAGHGNNLPKCAKNNYYF